MGGEVIFMLPLYFNSDSPYKIIVRGGGGLKLLYRPWLGNNESPDFANLPLFVATQLGTLRHGRSGRSFLAGRSTLYFVSEKARMR
jgi:hypothetical protein